MNAYRSCTMPPQNMSPDPFCSRLFGHFPTRNRADLSAPHPRRPTMEESSLSQKIRAPSSFRMQSDAMSASRWAADSSRPQLPTLKSSTPLRQDDASAAFTPPYASKRLSFHQREEPPRRQDRASDANDRAVYAVDQQTHRKGLPAISTTIEHGRPPLAPQGEI
jgi:hypothetical protein